MLLFFCGDGIAGVTDGGEYRGGNPCGSGVDAGGGSYTSVGADGGAGGSGGGGNIVCAGDSGCAGVLVVRLLVTVRR